MSALWFTYLFVTRRLPNQPFRKWDMYLVGVFFLLTAGLIQWSLSMLGITEIHQRRNFGEIAMGLFAFPSLVTSLIFGSWKV